MNELYTINWARLPHCPKEQLTKPGHPLDAGFDIHSAEDAIILPYKDIPWVWDEVASFNSFDESLLSTLVDHNKEDSPVFKVEGDIVYRRKYKFTYIKTGIKVQPEQLQWLGIYSRSSSSKYGIGLANAVGIIDLKYGQEVGLALYSFNEPTLIRKGERVAQLVSMFQPRTLLKEVYESDITNNRLGFGSTGSGIVEIPSPTNSPSSFPF